MKRRELRPKSRERYVRLVQDNTRNYITYSIDLSIVNCKFKRMKLLKFLESPISNILYGDDN